MGPNTSSFMTWSLQDNRRYTMVGSRYRASGSPVPPDHRGRVDETQHAFDVVRTDDPCVVGVRLGVWPSISVSAFLASATKESATDS